MAFHLVDTCHAACVNRSFIPCSQVPGTGPHSDADDSEHTVANVKSPQFCLYLTINSGGCNPLTHPPRHLTSSTT